MPSCTTSSCFLLAICHRHFPPFFLFLFIAEFAGNSVLYFVYIGLVRQTLAHDAFSNVTMSPTRSSNQRFLRCDTNSCLPAFFRCCFIFFGILYNRTYWTRTIRRRTKMGSVIPFFSFASKCRFIEILNNTGKTVCNPSKKTI